MSDWISGLPTNEPNALSELLGRGLPKWPGLVVVGERITPAQAAEVIVRTDSSVLHGPSGNDKDWVYAIAGAMGMEPDRTANYWMPKWEETEKARESVRAVNLEYLTNDRVSSAYIGGPKGWCGWDGFIGSNTFNIGKWPGCGEVYREWERIAAAFPFLSLRAQLMDGESCEGEIRPVIEYRVEGGAVAARDPEGTLLSMESDLTEGKLLARFTSPFAERGCSLRQFREAFEATRDKFAGEEDSSA